MSHDTPERALRTPADAALAMRELGMSLVGLIEGTKRPAIHGHSALGVVRLSSDKVKAVRGGVALVGGLGFFAVDIDEGGYKVRQKVERRLGQCECVVTGRPDRYKLVYATAAPRPPDDLVAAAHALIESGEHVAHAIRARAGLREAKAAHEARLRHLRQLKERYVTEHRLIRSCSRSSADGKIKVEILGIGRLIVMPPTVHPATGEPYRFEEGAELTETSFFLSREVKAEEVEALLDELAPRRARTLVTGRPARRQYEETELVPRLRSALEHLELDDYHLWIRVGMALKADLGDDGLELWEEASQRSDKHVDGDCEEKWVGFADTAEGGVGLGTIFFEATQAGWDTRTRAADDFRDEEIPAPFSSAPARIPARSDGATSLTAPTDSPEFERGKAGQVLNTLGNSMLAIASADLGLAYDDLAQRYVLRAASLPWEQDFGREVNDDILRIIRHLIMSTHGWEPSRENVVEAALTLATEARFNPVCDYLDAREGEWDGVERLDLLLTGYFGAPDGEYERQVGRKFMIAAVRRARKPGCKFDTMLILEGLQGSGKSSAVRILGGQYHSDAPLSNLENKDASIGLQNAWIVEHSELTSLSRAKVEGLKAFLSRTEDRFRAPFERTLRTVHRRCVFIGTTNESGYLRDLTGNRRFLPVKSGRIDLAALTKHRDQLWAEAAVAEAAGEPIELPRELWDEAAEQQALRLVDDPWISKLREHLERPNAPRRFSSSMLLEEVIGVPCSRQSQVEAKRLRQAMDALGWGYKHAIRIGGRVMTGYEAPDATQDLFGTDTAR